MKTSLFFGIFFFTVMISSFPVQAQDTSFELPLRLGQDPQGRTLTLISFSPSDCTEFQLTEHDSIVIRAADTDRIVDFVLSTEERVDQGKGFSYDLSWTYHYQLAFIRTGMDVRCYLYRGSAYFYEYHDSEVTGWGEGNPSYGWSDLGVWDSVSKAAFGTFTDAQMIDYIRLRFLRTLSE